MLGRLSRREYSGEIQQANQHCEEISSRALPEIHSAVKSSNQSLSLRVMENDPQGVSLSGMNGADAVTKVGAIVAARASNGSMMNCKDYRVALLGSEHFDPGLPARLLFGKHEFTAGEVAPALAQEKSELKRKHHVTIKILVQAVEVTGAILQQQWRWTILVGAMTLVKKVLEGFRIARQFTSKPVSPTVGNRDQMRIDGRPELLNNWG